MSALAADWLRAAEQIDDDEARAGFLQNAPVHRALHELGSQRLTDTPARPADLTAPPPSRRVVVTKLLFVTAELGVADARCGPAQQREIADVVGTHQLAPSRRVSAW